MFLVLGSLAFGLFVADRVVTIAGGFSSILLVIFLAWLLSFLVAQAADALRRRLGIRRGLAIVLVYIGVILFVGLLIYDTVQIGAHDTADILSRSNEATTRIHDLLVGAQRSLGLSRTTIDLAATFDQGLPAIAWTFHPILVLLALLVGSQIAGLWGAFFGIPFVAVLNLLVRFFINRRVVNEVEGIDLEDVVAEVRAVNPEISLEEAVAIAADQAEEIAADQAHATESESPA